MKLYSQSRHIHHLWDKVKNSFSNSDYVVPHGPSLLKGESIPIESKKFAIKVLNNSLKHVIIFDPLRQHAKKPTGQKEFNMTAGAGDYIFAWH